MPQIELKQYADEIARLIDDGQVDVAIEHCRHILGFYPRYLPVYRLLARASMEKGDYAHATHFLQSLLSADPENADAWADLASLSDDLGELEQATWLMERAFEIEPGKAEIRDRLRDLYKRRDGIDRPRLKLTAGALGRMYAMGGFYRRAIHELQRILESRPGLPPLHTAYLEVALARAFCHAQDMEDMAETVCQSLLGKLPNCLQANLMMGQILWSRGRAEEAEVHFAAARTLDPEGRAAQELFGDRSPIPFERVQVPHLEVGEEATVVAQPKVPAQPTEDTSWLDQVGEAFEGEAGFPALSERAAEPQAPDWLGKWSAQEAPADEEEAEEAAAEGAAGPPERQPVGRTAPLPEWMVEAPPEEAQTETHAVELPSWLTEDVEEQAGPAEEAVAEAAPPPVVAEEEEEEAVELPAWLRELASEAEPAQELEAVSEEEPETRWVTPPEEGTAAAKDAEQPGEAPGELAADELPDWLKAFGEQDLEQEAEVEEPTAQVSEEELPEWMQTPALDTEELAEEEAAEEVELPSWLRGLDQADEHVAALPGEEEPAEVEYAASLDEEALPDWLRDLRAQQPDLSEGEGEALQWMAEEEEEEEGEEEIEIEPIEEEELPDWLRELRTQEPAIEEPLAGTLVETEEQAAATPSWTERDAEVESLPEEELPDWLQELRAQETVTQPEPAEELAVEGELPDWLSEIEAEEATEVGTETVGEEELPDWLRELRAQEPASWDEEEGRTLVEPRAAQPPDWLAEIQGEDESELPAEAIDEEALPDWLRELHAQEPGLLSAEEEAVGPGWPVEPEAEVEPGLEPTTRTTEEEELPDWLRALRAAEAEPASVEPSHAPVQPVESAEPVEQVEHEGPRAGFEMPQPVEGMPAWLSDLEAEIAGGTALAPAAGAPTETPEEPPVSTRPQLGVHEGKAEAVEAGIVVQPEAEGTPEVEEAVTGEAAPSLELAPEDVAEWTETAVPVEAAEYLAEAELEAEPTGEPELAVAEEAVPTPEVELVGELPETAEAAGPVLESGFEEAAYEGAQEAVAEERDWVRELETPALSEELTVSASALDLTPPEAVAEMPPAEVCERPAEEREAVPAAAEAVGPAQRLDSARMHLADLALDDAAREYQQLVDTAPLQAQLLGDLEQAVEAHPDHPALLRVLGDVYVRTGQLQKALRAYRQALHNL